MFERSAHFHVYAVMFVLFLQHAYFEGKRVGNFCNSLHFLQSFQGHGIMRPSSVGSPATPSQGASQSVQSLNQPWLSSGPIGKPPLPSTAYRQQLNPPSMQQRSHIPPQQQSTPISSQQQQQQPPLSNQSQEHFGQQVQPSRAPHHVPHQQQVTRLQGPGNQKPSSLMAAQTSAVQPGSQSRLTNADTEESCNSILSKRSIHELVNQVKSCNSILQVPY